MCDTYNNSNGYFILKPYNGDNHRLRYVNNLKCNLLDTAIISLDHRLLFFFYMKIPVILLTNQQCSVIIAVGANSIKV